MRDNFYNEHAVAEFRRIAQAHPNTEFEAAALVGEAQELHSWANKAEREGDSALATQLRAERDDRWMDIAERYPDTKYWFQARLGLIRGESQGMAELFTEVGVPTVEDIRVGRVSRIKGESIPIQYRTYILGTYLGMGDTDEEKVRFLLFVRQSFPDSSALDRLQYHFLGKIGGYETFDDTLDVTPATVEVLSPGLGSQVSPGQASLLVRAYDGDIRSRQIDLGSSAIELDGQDILSDCILESQIDAQGPLFEILTIRYTPATPLSPGLHTYRVAIKEAGDGQITEKIIPFMVTTTPPGPTTETLPATSDSTLIIREPHQNEGANPRLHLKKVTGKPAQVVVGFDTSGIDTTGLTKASLVLDIDSTQNVTGWGNGRAIRAQRLLTAWTEGNGKKLGLPNNQQSSGSGGGVTWFSPIDSNISNSQADSAANWNGGASYAAPSTAPTVTIKNHQSGEVIFDVTQDLLAGANHGWLITRDQDVGSQVTFLSKESGNPELAPRLILEYGGPIASAPTGGLLSQLGIHSFTNKLHPITGPSELRSIKQLVQESPTAILVVEHLLTETTRTSPVLGLATRVAYRSWVELS
ncbi:MAG: hypothetical protein WC423_17505 [Vulcanimicrobiota bacterium]